MKLYLNFQLEPMQGLYRCRMQESPIGRGGELDQQFRSTGHGFRHSFTPTAKLQNDRIPRGVAVVDGHIVLHVITLGPNLQSPHVGLLLLLVLGRRVQSRLAPDGDQLTLSLPDCDQGVLSRRHLVLPHRIVTGEVSRIHSWEIG